MIKYGNIFLLYGVRIWLKLILRRLRLRNCEILIGF